MYNALNAVSKSQTKNVNNKPQSVNESQIISPNDMTLTNTNNNILDDESFLSPKSSRRNLSSTALTNGGVISPNNTLNRAKSPLSPPSNRALNSPRDKTTNKTTPSQIKNEKGNLSFNKSNFIENSFSERPINETIKFDSLEVINKALNALNV